MAEARFCTGPSRSAGHDLLMDVVAVLVGIATFAILLGLINAIDRI